MEKLVTPMWPVALCDLALSQSNDVPLRATPLRDAIREAEISIWALTRLLLKSLGCFEGTNAHTGQRDGGVSYLGTGVGVGVSVGGGRWVVVGF